MKILICSRYFAPQNTIGAVRPTMFAKYLSQFGHEVTVITEKVADNNAYINYSFEVIEVEGYKLATNIKQKRVNKTQSNVFENKEQCKIKKLYIDFRRFTVGNLLDFLWFKKVKHCIGERMQGKHYDIVFSSYGPLSSFYIGQYIYKKNIADFWVSDMRDLMINYLTPIIYYPLFKYYLYSMQKHASKITVVSQGQKNILKSFFRYKYIDDNIVVIYNGFTRIFRNHNFGDNTLRLIYTGTLYAHKSDMSILFKAIWDLFIEDKIDINKIQIHYAGADEERLKSLDVKYNLQRIVFGHGLISRNDSFLLQETADILLVCSWNLKNEQGILTGKFLEYLPMQRPIIAMITGDSPKAELTSLIDELKVGISCEYVNYESDLLRLKNFILSAYEEKQKNGKVSYHGDVDNLKQFDYYYLTKKLEKLFTEVAYGRNN